MASLTNTKIKDTYDGLLKTTDNDALGGTYKLITDGLGNSSNVYLGTGGRLGIGTSSPTETLDVRGSVKIGKSGTSPYLTFDEEPDSGSGSEFYLTHDISGNILKFTDDNSNNLIAMDRDTGYVGIGTTSPSVDLHIKGSSASASIVINGSSGSNNRIYGDNVGNLIYQADTENNGANSSHRWKIDGSEKMRIDSSGNVGVGTTSPGALLHVNSGTIDNVARFESTDGSSKIEIKDSSDSVYVGTVAGTRMFLGFDPNAGTTDLTIRNDGKVGIGTTNPSHNLTINSATGAQLQLQTNGIAKIRMQADSGGGSFYAPSGAYIRYFTSGSERMRITSDGNVGIGTSSPSAKFQVSGNSLFYSPSGVTSIDLTATTTNNTEINFGSYGASSNVAKITGLSGTLGLSFETNTSERMRIDSSGRVGIGVSSPSEKLDINGNIKMSNGSKLYTNGGIIIAADDDESGAGNILFKTVGNERMRIDSSGDLNIVNTGQASLNFTTDGSSDYARIIGGKSGSGVGDLRFFTYSSGIAERMRIDSSGNVLVGITTVNNTDGISLRNDGIALAKGFQPNNGAGSVGGQTPNIYSPAAATLAISTNSTERMRITSGGDVLIGTTGVPNGTSIYGSGFTPTTNGRSLLRMASSSTSSNTLAVFYNPNGSVGSIVTSGSSTAYNTTSDYRLKENVIDMTGALDRVEQLQPKRFNFISDAETTVDGFIAHEVQSVIPEAITGEKDAVNDEGNPEYQGIDQSKIVPLLVGAIKELKAEIETLKSQINS